ncbi:alpha-terpineol synthase, chloroplastic-like isoform X3 [Phragmites australis]|uniref:alpha-terpineol synthase, chloroplastic-like isoform X3 n=1 Tax=Phragmites australis TaxID=29695 RepID=UPI002D790181|nr:alpha-terpineol synthase, chloroplastic-like isoform X3 [Phragmites australis]
MMTAFSLQPRQCYGSGLLATAASPRPSIFWRWRQQQQCTMLKYSQVEQQSAQTLHYDNRDEKVDDRLGKNPCNFHPSIWGDFFLHYSNPAASSEQQQTWMAERADKLKEEVAKMIASSVTCSLHQRLQLIHVLERLCLDHLFEEEINDALIQIKTADVSDCDLHTVAMWFYLLRKYGYRVIPDVFLRFKDEEGCFFTNNPMDLLSLYNAAHLRTHGETILDEAILFTRRCLETTLLPSLEGSLAREIKCALEIPLPRRVRIYESKYYISTYEKEATVHESVLQLAKLNSNIMQLHHQKELRIVTSWWKDLEIESRWDKKAAHDLPECMKFALGKILDSYQTIEQELAHEEKYRMSYLKAFTVDMVRAFNMEVKMREEGYTPRSVEEHLQFSIWTSGCHVVSCTTFVGMDDIATKDSFDWVSTMPKMVKALCIILRLLDDLQSYEREQLTPHVASTIQSYMTEHNVTIEVARKKIEELKEESWKDFNGEWLNPDNAPPKQLLERIFNLTRTMEFFYNLDDNFSNSQNLRDTILSLFVEHFEVF